MRRFIAQNLASAFLSGPWTLEGLVERGSLACSLRRRALRTLVRPMLTTFEQPPARDAVEALTAFLEGHPSFLRAWARYGEYPVLPRQIFWVTPRMEPVLGAPSSWQVPPLITPIALADWLGLEPRQLDWFADCQGREAKMPAGPLRHYTYGWRAKRHGPPRLLEIPKQRLKGLQRRMLHEILDKIPPHEAAHGYRRGRSVTSYVAPHASRAIVLHFDLRDFFPSIHSSRIHALFCTVGYPRAVARLLTGLCSNVVPWEVWQTAPWPEDRPREWQREQRFHLPHLPQGAPTSPALANLCAYRLDCRLAALAYQVGAHYTRYADDLAFSGGLELECGARRFQVAVCRIALEEGFEIHTRKTRFMRQGVRQQLGGIVLNAQPNLRRREYDRLKAILYNCARDGPQGHNRTGEPDFRAHLAGRVAYVAMINPGRGRRLSALFERIRWKANEAQGKQEGD
jgi:hypothetical protein